MCLLVLEDQPNARLAMMRPYAGLKGREDEGKLVRHVSV
jgi:hypothetical protein